VPTEASASGSVSAAGTGSNDSVAPLLLLLPLCGCCWAAIFFLIFKQNKEDKDFAAVAPVQDREDLKKAVHYRDEMKQAFDSFDIDNSGGLDKEEFRKVMTHAHAGSADTALTDIEFEALFEKADMNASGVISFDEYFAWAQYHGPIGWPRANLRDERETNMRVKMDALRAEESDSDSDDYWG
jgi:hypothetical protein